MRNPRRLQRGIFGIDDAIIGSLGGALLGGLFGSSNQKAANETNIQLGREQMQFQERMSNTAYPRAVQGMKDAGLNPMLAYSQGGASAPMGSMPQVQSIGTAGISGAQAGKDVAAAIQQMMQSQAQTEQITAQTDKIRSETMAQSMNSALLASQVDKTQEEVWKTREEGAKSAIEFQSKREQWLADLKADTFSADSARRKAESQIAGYGVAEAKAGSEFYKGIGEFNPYVRMLIELLKGGGSVRSMMRK